MLTTHRSLSRALLVGTVLASASGCGFIRVNGEPVNGKPTEVALNDAGANDTEPKASGANGVGPNGMSAESCEPARAAVMPGQRSVSPDAARQCRVNALKASINAKSLSDIRKNWDAIGHSEDLRPVV